MLIAKTKIDNSYRRDQIPIIFKSIRTYITKILIHDFFFFFKLG